MLPLPSVAVVGTQADTHMHKDTSRETNTRHRDTNTDIHSTRSYRTSRGCTHREIQTHAQCAGTGCERTKS